MCTPNPPQDEPLQSLPFEQTFNKGSLNKPPPIPSTQPNIETPETNLPPQIKPKPIPKNTPRCFKCQDYGHTSADCTNRRVITLTDWEGMENEEETDETMREEQQQEEIVVYAVEGDMLKSKPFLNIQKSNIHPIFKAQTTSSPKEWQKDKSFTPKMVELRPYLNNRHLLNLRTNYFQ